MFDLFKTKIFTRFFLSCIIFFVIPFLVFNIIIVSISSNSYRSDVTSLNLEYSKNLKNNLDSQLAEIKLNADLLLNSNEVWSFAVKDKNIDYTEYIYSAKNVSNVMSSYSKYRGTFHNTSLYFPVQDSVISSTSMLSLKEYYKANFEPSMSFEDFETLIKKDGGAIFAAANANGEDVIVFASTLYGSTHQYSVFLISLINMHTMIDKHKLLNAHDTLNPNQSESYTVITDADNNILFSSETMPKQINMKTLNSLSEERIVNISSKYYASSHVSDIYPLNYISIFSDSDVSTNFRLTRTILYVIIVLCGIAFVFVSYRFSLKNISPIKALITVGSQNEGLPYKIENYSQIETLVLDIVNSNNNLKKTIEKQKLSISNNLFHMLLENSMKLDENSFEIMFEDHKKTFPLENFQVAIIRTKVQNKDKLAMLKFSILAFLRSEAEEKGIYYFVIPSLTQDIIVLFNHSGKESILNDIMQNMLISISFSDIPIYIGMGRIVHSLNHFSKSYEDALCAIAGSENTGSENVKFYDGTNSKALYNLYFTNDDKRKLQKSLIEGNSDEVTEFFKTYYDVLFKDNILTARILTYIFFSLSNLLSEVVDSLKIHNTTIDAYINECQQAFQGHDFNENFNVIKTNFILVAEYICIAKMTSNLDLKNKMLSYIDTNFCNPDISLRQVSKDIHVSYNYLCKFFKQQTGMVFLDYLHNLRINKSKELLKNSNKSIGDIATAVGYLSTNSYIRKFKQLVCITPGEYRRKFDN